MNLEQSRQNSVDFLIKAASLLPAENYQKKLLKSFYLAKCKKIANSEQNSIFSEEEMCRKCSTPWTDLNYLMSIAPIKTTQRKARKIHKQIEEKAKRKNHLAKKLSQLWLCDSKNKIILWKKPAVQIVPANKVDDVLQQMPAKKKKKKDENAGLLHSFNKLSVQKVANPSKQLDDKKITNQPPSVQIKVNAPITTKANTSKLLNVKPNQGITKNKNTNKPKKQDAPKVKTKNVPQVAPKRTSILQLTNALKAKSSQYSGSSHG